MQVESTWFPLQAFVAKTHKSVLISGPLPKIQEVQARLIEVSHCPLLTCPDHLTARRCFEARLSRLSASTASQSFHYS